MISSPSLDHKTKRFVNWGEYMELHCDWAVRQKKGWQFPPEPAAAASSLDEDVWKLFTQPEVDDHLDRLLTPTDEAAWSLIPADQEVKHTVNQLPPRPPRAPLLPLSEWFKMVRQQTNPPIGVNRDEVQQDLDRWGVLNPLPTMNAEVPVRSAKSMELKYPSKCHNCKKALHVGETALGSKPEGGRWQFECIRCSFVRLESPAGKPMERGEPNAMAPPVGRPTKRSKKVWSID